jgi:HK97 family phage major capsid protein
MTDMLSKKQEVIEEKEETKEIGFKAEYEKMSDPQKMESFYKALLRNDTAKLKVMSVGDQALGGYLVPTVLYNQIVEEMRDEAIIRPLATVIPNCPATLQVDSLVGRPKASWRAEKAVKDTTTATFTQVSLTPYSLATIAPMTNELIADAEVGGLIVSMMTRLIAVAINEKEDQAFMAGTGVTQPTGIDAYNATVHRRETTPANVLTADSLIATFGRLGQKYRKNASWIMNSVTLTKVRQLKDSQNRYLFIDDLTSGGNIVGTILGRPVYEQNDLTHSRIWFGDVKGYWIGDRGGITVAKSEEATLEGVGNLFEKNMTAIRVEKRVDGELVDLDAFVVLSGTN